MAVSGDQRRALRLLVETNAMLDALVRDGLANRRRQGDHPI
jgi:hypothetical protein